MPSRLTRALFMYAAYHPTQAPPHVRDDIALQLNMGEAHVRLVASCRRYVRTSKQSSKQSSKHSSKQSSKQSNK